MAYRKSKKPMRKKMLKSKGPRKNGVPRALAMKQKANKSFFTGGTQL